MSILETVKASILEDIQSGVVPSTVQTFAELHDHVDANEYFLADDGSMLGTPDECMDLLPFVDAWLDHRND